MHKRYWPIFWLLGFGLALAAAMPAAAVERKKEPTFIEKMTQELQHGMMYRRMLALEKLRRVSSADAIALIIRSMLHDHAKPVRRAAQQLLAGFDDPRIAESIVAGLKDQNRAVRMAAIDVAGLVRDPQMANRLIDTLKANPRDYEMARLIMDVLRELVYRVEPPEGFEYSVAALLGDPHIKIRRSAVIILAILGRPGSLPALLPLWPKADRTTRVFLADAFANINRVEAVPDLMAALDLKDKQILLHSLYALAQIQSFTALPKIQQLMLNNTNFQVQMACLYALVEIPDASSIPMVKQMLASRDVSVLHWAIYALSQLNAIDAAPALRRLLADPRPMIRASAATALGVLKIAAAQDDLLKLIRNNDEAAEVKVAATRALMQLGNAQAGDVLALELSRPHVDLNTRLTYAMALAAIGSNSVTAQIAVDLDSDDFTKSFAASLVLGLRGDNRGKERLISSLEHGYPAIRRFAIMGLENIQDQEVTNALALTANDDEDPVVRILAAASLVHMGWDDFRVVLWNALETPQEDLRSEALIALGRTASEEVIQQLKWYLKREPSIPVRQTIHRILRDRQENQ